MEIRLVKYKKNYYTINNLLILTKNLAHANGSRSVAWRLVCS